MIFNFLLFQ